MSEHTIIIPLGTGGGVIMGPYGDSNYAIIPNVPDGEDVVNNRFAGEDLGHEEHASYFLAKYPYWLIDCGPQTAAWLCGGSGSPVTPERSNQMIQNLKGIIFTHAHTDHMGGLPMLLWRFIFVEKVSPVIFAHYELEAAIRRVTDEIRYWNGAQLKKLLPLDSGMPRYRERFRPEIEHFVNLRLLTAGSQRNSEIPFKSLELFRVDHNIDGIQAFGVKIVTPYDNGFPSFVFSGDSVKPIEELADPNNIVFHDCQTYNSDPATAVHCHLDWLKKAVTPNNRKRVNLVHSTTKPTDCKGFQWAPRFAVLIF